MKQIPNFRFIQGIIWLMIYLLVLLLTMRNSQDFWSAFFTASMNSITFILAIYSNSHFLIPWLFQKRKYIKYGIAVVLTMTVLIVTKAVVEYFIFYKQLHILPLYYFGVNHFAYTFLMVLFCMIIGFLLRMSLDYGILMKDQERLKSERLAAELNLLKSQVQPHFMFNTLNNIYSLANARSDKTAEMIAKLSSIMRYFVDEVSKERVPLSLEIDFIKSYIDLEKIRMLYPLEIRLECHLSNEKLMVPPMLFVPFIENIFKHGVDKTKTGNKARIHFSQNNERLLFEADNEVQNAGAKNQNGVGFSNIRKRLELLYAGDYKLQISQEQTHFGIKLSIPV